MLTECRLLGCKPVDTPMLHTRKLLPEDGDPMKDPGCYRRLVGKLNYLTVTRPDISFTVNVLSQFMVAPYTGHWDVALRVLRYLKITLGLVILYSDQGHWVLLQKKEMIRYLAFQMQTGQSKNQHTISRSSAESEYRAMADVTLEMIWVCRLLIELEHIEVNCHLIKDRVVSTQAHPPTIQPIHVKTKFQLADILTKPLRKTQIYFICNRLGMINIYAPT
ncbi:hypothetical protein OSB04_003002 [Centaurea solstitialis]|uniref:Reverse transcriptase Ty1/copia-type domain-containing protein n=1 Tax=Centaurea solstitialis TaxID=347529 RepID=A0AA38WVJ0_9ASTR|nr:hypothetical protein OSB04_003002 [Centaurea solstitialis]